MPYHQSSVKRMRSSKKRNIRNRMARSEIKTVISKVQNSSDKPSAEAVLKKAYSVIDKGAKKGIIHKKNAAHKKARLAKLIGAIKA